VIQRTKVDWLAGRTKKLPAELISAIAPVLGQHAGWLNMSQRAAGWMGYQSSADLRIADQNIGMVAWGGEHQRQWCYVSITGQGCSWIEDWDRAQDCLSELPDWQPRRVDIALDSHHGESSHEIVLASYRSGGFTTSGRPPKLLQIIGEDPLDGRTINIGARSSEKYFRSYEKGRELARGNAALTHIGGIDVSTWQRNELELKVKDNPLPADIIDRRDQYFAGAYPYCQTLLSEVDPEILVRLRDKVPQLELRAALENVKRQYGRTLFTAMVAHGGDLSRVWGLIAGTEHNMDLLRAGVLNVEHV
jgi:phage replication initiation protein